MAGPPYRREEEEEDAGEELDESDYKDQKDAVIFAIEISSSMLKPPPATDSKKADKDTAVSAALKCAYQVMQQRIISQPKDMMGILFFGTNKSKFRDEDPTRNNYPNLYLYMDLDVPAAADVNALRKLVEEDGDEDEILEPSKEPVDISVLLNCANRIFTSSASNFGSRRLFLITDNDSPHANNKEARFQAAIRAKDLYDLSVIIELFPISREDKKFDLSKFYDDIIYRDPAAEEGASGTNTDSKSGDGFTLLNSLISNINSKQTPKRAYFSDLTFQIAPGLMISVNGYITMNHQKPARTCYVWLEGSEAKLATSKTEKIVPDTAEVLSKAQVMKAYKFGGEYVHFKPEETKGLKDWSMGQDFKGGKGLRIIGFKPRSMLPNWAAVKKSYFIFPTEIGYSGSTRVFSALWQKLLNDKKMGIAWFVPRSNATPVLVAILPSAPRDNEDAHTPFLPAGLWLYPLPFADDIRDVNKTETKKCSTELIDQMRTVVENLQLPKGMYDPSKYPNPSLQWHYQVLQYVALGEEDFPDQPDTDPTAPKFKAINKRVGGYIVDFNESVKNEAETLRTSRAIKRDAEDDDDDAPPAKKARAAPAAKKSAGGGARMDGAKLKVAAEQGTLNKMTVVELKEVLTIRNLSITGKKAELVERVEQWVEENT